MRQLDNETIYLYNMIFPSSYVYDECNNVQAKVTIKNNYAAIMTPWDSW